MKNVIIIGTGGHAKVIADIVIKNGDKIYGFLDSDKEKKFFLGYRVLGTEFDYNKFPDCFFIIAIGNDKIREQISKILTNAKWYNAIHPSAIISSIDVTIGEGTVVMANAVINSCARIGNHCILNTSSIVEHDNVIADFSHVSVGVKLGGTCSIGRHTWIGIGATITNNINICDNCIIGAGAVVVKNISVSGTYIGVPAKKKL